MWNQQIMAVNRSSFRHFNKFTLVLFPLLYSTCFIDSLVLKITNNVFAPGIPITTTDLVLTSITTLAFTAVVIVLIKTRNRITMYIIGVLIGLICYIVTYESNSNSMPIYEAIIG